MKSQLYTCITQPYRNIPLAGAMENAKICLWCIIIYYSSKIVLNFQHLGIYAYKDMIIINYYIVTTKNNISYVTMPSERSWKIIKPVIKYPCTDEISLFLQNKYHSAFFRITKRLSTADSKGLLPRNFEVME